MYDSWNVVELQNISRKFDLELVTDCCMQDVVHSIYLGMVCKRVSYVYIYVLVVTRIICIRVYELVVYIVWYVNVYTSWCVHVCYVYILYVCMVCKRV
jgi:hypothetical protein